jgi:4-amino-4-deoxy-L-arabinose transferase-like glycosyltransferase
MKNLYKKINKEIIFLIVIVFIGSLFRFYRLGEIPVGFHQDEAFFGYNAYSILKTGKDMTGNFLPIHLQSFWYSPGLYSYFAIPFIVLFNLTPFAVRIPSALFGTVTIIALYFLVKELFKKYEHSNYLGLIASFFLAINPWSINLSRTATENIPVTFFVVLGILLFLYWIRDRKLFLLLISFLIFFTSLFVYQAPRAFLPIFIPVLLLLVYKKLSIKKLYPFFTMYLILIVIPVILFVRSPQLSTRIKSLSIFTSPRTQLLLDETIREDGLMHQPPVVARIFHNKPLAYLANFVSNYSNHLSYNFFFTDQALPLRYKIPDMGLIYLFELPLILIGVFFLLKNRMIEGIFIIAWVLLSPVSSALTFDDVPNLQRTVMLYPALAIISSFGLLQVYTLISGYRRYLKQFIAVGLIIIIYSVLYYSHQYFIQQVVHQPVNRQEGYEKLVPKVNTLLPEYEKAYVTATAGSPAILFLFFSRYDPAKFQRQVANLPAKTVDKIDRIAFDKYSFYNQDCFDNFKKNILYIQRGTCGIPDQNFYNTSEIKREDGSVVFRIVTLK